MKKGILVVAKKRIYVDTSVIGGCFDPEFSKWSILMMDAFKSENIILVISDLTIKELEYSPVEVRKLLDEILESSVRKVFLTEEAEYLAGRYIMNDVVSPGCIVDAQHIAVATVENVDLLVSWNFKHIVNVDRIRGYNSVNLRHGYRILEIRSPREVIHEKEI